MNLMASGDAASVRDLLTAYLRAMVQAMDSLTAGEIALANNAVTLANDLASRSSAALSEALVQRPWLVC